MRHVSSVSSHMSHVTYYISHVIITCLHPLITPTIRTAGWFTKKKRKKIRNPPKFLDPPPMFFRPHKKGLTPELLFLRNKRRTKNN